MIAKIKQILKSSDFIETCIGIIIIVPFSVWVGVTVGNGNPFDAKKETRYSQTIINPEVMADAGERFTDGAAVITSQGKGLRDVIYQRSNIDDLRLLREIHAAEEKALMENMRR